MPRTYVALDLETTGLRPDRDAIIEIGLVKYRDGQTVDEFSTLVDPGRPIPYEVQQLTGISDTDVLGKPRLSEVSGQVMRFAGQLPVVAHNVSFDLGFLHSAGLCMDNVGLDTWELATVLLPNQSSYSLGALTRQLGIVHESQHRALSDTYAAGELFLRLCELAARLPRAVLMEINRLTQHGYWALAPVFQEALSENEGLQIPQHELTLEQLAPDSPLFQPLRLPDALEPRENPEPVDVDGIAAMLLPGGAVGTAFPNYEFRPPQLEMLKAVTGAFNEQHHMMAEAGTGTGKSLAYLLPAIAYAVHNGTRVVISTNTINLQDQLYRKDLPDLQRILSQAWHKEPAFRAALLKGRSNYFCPRRFAALRARPDFTPEELRSLARILVWLPTTQSGDQGELSLPTAGDRFVWAQMCADNEGCSLDRCQREMRGRCFFYRARKLADAAHVVIVNHALLMADAATANRVLPEYHHLIVDEAHHLEDAVTDQLSFRADSQTLNQLIHAILPPGAVALSRVAAKNRGAASLPKAGLIGELLACLRPVPADLQEILRHQIMQLQGEIEMVYPRIDDFWSVLQGVLRDLQPAAENGEYDVRVRVTPTVRTQSLWVEIEVSWENLSLTLQTLLKRLQNIYGGLQDLREGGFDPPGLESVVEEWGGTLRQLSELTTQMEQWANKPEPNGIYWAEVNGQTGRTVLRSAPLNVGPLVQEHVLFRNDTVIFTSATLRTAGNFDYVRDRLQCYEADTICVGSPFDYQESTLLYLPSDLPEPNASGYQRAVELSLTGLVKALGGRTLALFTSYAQLRRSTEALRAGLAGTGIEVLSQSTGTSRHQLLEVFKSTSKTVLLGTRSFWEGVDVVGPALSALVLVRLPFAVPSDPIVAARSETFDDAFYSYSVPDAILRFRQGFGRLIRSKTDRGVVVVLDKRVQSKKYGQLFLDSLPECTVHHGPLMNLPAAAQKWVNRG